MKVFNHFSVILFLLLFSSATFAEFTKAQTLELEKHISKTQRYLKNILTSDLSNFSEIESLLLDVNLAVNVRGIYKEVGGLDDSWNDIKKMKLPGLFLNSSHKQKIKEVKAITMDNILNNIKSLGIKVTVSQDNLDESEFKKKIEAVLNSNFNQLSKINLNIEITKGPSLIKELPEVKIAAPVVSKVVEVAKNIKKWEDYVPHMMAFGLIMLGLVLLFINVFRKSMNSIKSSIDEKVFAPAKNDFKEEAVQTKIKEETQPVKQQESGDFESYMELVEKMRLKISKNSSVISEMISLQLELEGFEELVVLMEIIPQDQRTDVYSQLPKRKVEKFKAFLLEQGDSLYSGGNLLLTHAKTIFRTLSLSAIEPSNFYRSYARKVCQQLNVSEIQEVLRHADVNEFGFIIDFVNPAKLSHALATGQYDVKKLTSEYKKLDNDQIRSFLVDVTKVIGSHNTFSVKNIDPRERILPYLEGRAENLVHTKLKKLQECAFNKLFEMYLNDVAEFVRVLSIGEGQALLAVLDKKSRNLVLVKLPEVVSSRLSLDKYELTDTSFVMKAKLYNFLQGQYEYHKDSISEAA